MLEIVLSCGAEALLLLLLLLGFPADRQLKHKACDVYVVHGVTDKSPLTSQIYFTSFY